jgi:hypothetical protein
MARPPQIIRRNHGTTPTDYPSQPWHDPHRLSVATMTRPPPIIRRNHDTTPTDYPSQPWHDPHRLSVPTMTRPPQIIRRNHDTATWFGFGIGRYCILFRIEPFFLRNVQLQNAAGPAMKMPWVQCVRGGEWGARYSTVTCVKRNQNIIEAYDSKA